MLFGLCNHAIVAEFVVIFLYDTRVLVSMYILGEKLDAQKQLSYTATIRTIYFYCRKKTSLRFSRIRKRFPFNLDMDVIQIPLRGMHCCLSTQPLEEGI